MTVVENSLVCVAFVIHSRCVEARLPWVGPGANKEVNISLSVFPGAGLSLSRVPAKFFLCVCRRTAKRKENWACASLRVLLVRGFPSMA